MCYPSDLIDTEWAIIEPFFVYNNGYGNRAKYPRREIVNAVLYITKTGAQWRQLPLNFPPWKTVYSYFRRLCLNGTWTKVLNYLIELNRKKYGKLEHPSYAIIDSQSVKTTYNAENRGIDGGKKNQGSEATYCN